MFCLYCGKEMEDGLQFCTSCGKPLGLDAADRGANAGSLTSDGHALRENANETVVPALPVIPSARADGSRMSAGARRRSKLPVVLLSLFGVLVVLGAAGFAAWNFGLLDSIPIFANSRTNSGSGGDTAGQSRSTGSSASAPSASASSPAEEKEDAKSEKNPSTVSDAAGKSGSSDAAQPDGRNASTFARLWEGSFEGYSKDVAGGVLTTRVTFQFSSVSEKGALVGTCVVESYDAVNGQRRGSYMVEGTVNWNDGSIDIYGTKWIDSGDYLYMREFKGKLANDGNSIAGTSKTLSGDHEGKWEMTAKR